ncbi:MAG: hemerythrin domain-containing protein [Elusimicrobia bacterium]|nr:hemerythrin domain-containing protein [Elusimicrobiota bacterium]
MGAATDILQAEHRNIERMLIVLEGLGRKLPGGGVPAPDLEDAVRFVREYADKLHHGKEEAILFAEMEKAGFPHDAGPIAVMLAEHEEGRAYVRELAAAAERLKSGGEAGGAAAFAAARYVGLLREHIQKEDTCLYPMANERFTLEQQRRLEAAFLDVDAKTGFRAIGELLALLKRLEGVYGATPAR